MDALVIVRDTAGGGRAWGTLALEAFCAGNNGRASFCQCGGGSFILSQFTEEGVVAATVEDATFDDVDAADGYWSIDGRLWGNSLDERFRMLEFKFALEGRADSGPFSFEG